MPVDKFGRMSDLKTKDTGVSLTYINNNYVRSDGETPLTGSLDMRGNTLYNVADPVNPQDVVTKVYVDNTKGSGVIGRKTGNGVSIKENLDFLGKQKIKNLPDPVNEKDAVTKEYVDTTTTPFLKLDQTKYNTKGDIDMGDQFTVLNVKTPIDDNHITNKKYVDEMDNLNSAFAFKNGSYYAKGGIIMRKNKLGGLREPLQDGEAANKKYVDDTTKNLFIDENDNIAFGLNVDMEGNQILGLPEPATDQEPATKKYVDDLQTQNVDEKGNIKFGRSINLDRNRIFSMKEPTKPSEGANKKYVDDTITKRLQEEKDNFLPQDPATKEYVDEAIKQVAGGDILVSKEGVFIKANGHYRATAPLDIDNHKMENLPDPVDDKDAVNKKYIDGIVESLTLKQGLIRENGGFNLVDSYINMNFNNIRNLGLPKHEADAVPRLFVDNMIKEVEEKIQKIKEKSEERPFLKENGKYQASTSINMDFNKLLNLQKPTEPYDAATKDYVDYVEKEIKEKLEKRKHLIAVHARYCGPLKKGEYQFKFNGANFENCEETIKKYEDLKGSITGFVMPHSGHIKKIICENLVYRSLGDIAKFIFNFISTHKKDLQLSDFLFLKKYKYIDIEDLLKKGIDDFSKKMEEEEEDESFIYEDETRLGKLNNAIINFQIVKFEKSFILKDYPTIETPPKIISSVLIEKMKLRHLKFKKKTVGTGVIERIFNNVYFTLSEGDVINIKTNLTYDENIFNSDDKMELLRSNLDNFITTGLNFNFTFLIELDPL